MAGHLERGHRTNQGWDDPGAGSPGFNNTLLLFSRHARSKTAACPFVEVASCRPCRFVGRRGQARGLGRRPRPRSPSGAPRETVSGAPARETARPWDFKLTRQDLALACASHSERAGAVTLVREFLQRIGCSERDLMCGPHRPLSDAVAKDYEMRGVRLTPSTRTAPGSTPVCWRSRSTTAGRRSSTRGSSIPCRNAA